MNAAQHIEAFLQLPSVDLTMRDLTASHAKALEGCVREIDMVA